MIYGIVNFLDDKEEDKMYYQFLIEDRSSEILVNRIMEKIKKKYSDIYYDSKQFHGIGRLPKGNNAKEIKNGKLLNDLAIYMRGFNKSLQGMDSVLVIVVDNDDRIPDEFIRELEGVASCNQINIDYAFCIAIEEIEAWLLGDEKALLEAYPSARVSVLHNYIQDSICGTWEVLADVLYKGGYDKLKQNSSSYAEIGKVKCEWADRIGQCLDITKNSSPSFNNFISNIEKRAVC